MRTNKQINKEDFLSFCHTLYDELHGEEKINNIFDIPEKQINKIKEIYCDHFIWRRNKIHNYIKVNTNIVDDDASTFYVNAIQNYITNGN